MLLDIDLYSGFYLLEPQNKKKREEKSENQFNWIKLWNTSRNIFKSQQILLNSGDTEKS